jgi:hypothetical protein
MHAVAIMGSHIQHRSTKEQHMKRFMIGVGGLVVAAVVAVGLAACTVDGGHDDKVAEAAEPSPPPGTTEYDKPEIDPEPKGTYRIASCDLGSHNELVGSVRINNTGDVPLTAKVPFAWELEDGSTIPAQTQSEKLEEGGTRLVFFSVDVGLNTQLAFQGHPGYYRSSNCDSKVEITS